MSFSHSFDYMHLTNIQFIEKLYMQFLSDPNRIDDSWQYFFRGMEFGINQVIRKEPKEAISDLRIYHLIYTYRTYGYLQATCNPIALDHQKKIEPLLLSSLGFDKKDLDQKFPTYGLMKEPKAPLSAILHLLEETYCGEIGIDYMRPNQPKLQSWIQNKIETQRMKPNFSLNEKHTIFEYLTKAELFEVFLHTKYVGQKRFSLEGGETLIPMLVYLIEKGGESGIEEFVIGMAHRGRLNVLCNLLKKSYSTIFSEFQDGIHPIESVGDVKYHQGYESTFSTLSGKDVHLSLTPNPSHLESVNPVVEGEVYAKQLQRGDHKQTKVVPILIHGDAAIAGQGVVYETMQMHSIQGYSTGGTIHIILNNQIGFTTLSHEYRSSHYSTDIAHAFGFPIFHLNAEDPEGCLYVAELALQIRQEFHIDVLLELNCYRKYGHNESDEPLFTQPLEYTLIKKKQSIREIYRDRLFNQNKLERKIALNIEKNMKEIFDLNLEQVKLLNHLPEPPSDKKSDEIEIFESLTTAIPSILLKEIAKKFTIVPEGLEIHSKLRKLIQHRQEVIEKELEVDWAMGEHLAFATLLWEGIHVRLSGQDSQRGTFTQRHAVWVDQKTGNRYFPLSHLKQEQGLFRVYNSSLSEFGVLGFEFGYSLAYPSALVLWEAQFGDFANGGQVIFDQYLASSEKKWLRASGLVVLLPHGYEGQGAEHSSSRIERFLQLAAQSNMQIVYPTTPAQYFHLLRRQVKRKRRIPLIIFTPKGLLRSPGCKSPFEDFSKKTFQEILDDPTTPIEAERLILCCGRIYYDLIEARRHQQKKTAIIRLEQLYPIHLEMMKKLINEYKHIKEYYWVQEEPFNMGAYRYILPILQQVLPKTASIKYVGRKESAVTATGSYRQHLYEQDQIMKEAFG
ncbi:MAG: 2-oxoglutarate dehydrogenase E1 component [Chlamydiales bacterium]